MSEAPQLVLGLADRMTPESIRPFVVSLRRTGYRGLVGLVVGECDPTELEAIRSMVDLVWEVAGQYPRPPGFLLRMLRRLRTAKGFHRLYPLAFTTACRLGPEHAAPELRLQLEFHLEGLVALRWLHFYDVVLELDGIDALLLTDVRDVVFQADPFAAPVSGLELFAEERPATIGSESYNRRWMCQQYGVQALAKYADCQVSCCGTVIGDRESILHYLSEMRVEIRSKRMPLSGDQGVHNYLIWSGRLKEHTLVENGWGRVATVGGMKAVLRDDDGLVTNRDGTRPAVVHQYDRHPDLVAGLLPLLLDLSA